MKLDTTIVIPNYNGLGLLKEHLPEVIKYSHDCPVIVVDDASTDDSVTYLKSKYKNQVKVVCHQENQGFSEAVNTGFRQAKSKYVLLLNNDVKLRAQTLKRLHQTISQNNQYFGVGAQEHLADGSIRGRSSGRVARGLIVHSAADSQKSGITFWVFGASGIFDRRKWLKLGGLDRIYSPAYWEDIDIGYRAWKSGWQCWYNSQAKLDHTGEQSMTKKMGTAKERIVLRNQLLCSWKNITDWQLILSHFIWMPYHLVLTSYRTRGVFILAFIEALTKLDQVMRQPSLSIKRTDMQIQAMFNDQ